MTSGSLLMEEGKKLVGRGVLKGLAAATDRGVGQSLLEALSMFLC